jgi:hypothetical protein
MFLCFVHCPQPLHNIVHSHFTTLSTATSQHCPQPLHNIVHSQFTTLSTATSQHCPQPVHKTQPAKCTVFYRTYLYYIVNAEYCYMFQSKKKSSSEKMCKIILHKTYLVILTHNYHLMQVLQSQAVKHSSAFSKRFMKQRVHTVCTRKKYKIFLVTNLNKYLHCGTSGTA